MINESRLHKYNVLQFFWTVSLVQQQLMIVNNGQNHTHVQGWTKNNKKKKDHIQIIEKLPKQLFWS